MRPLLLCVTLVAAQNCTLLGPNKCFNNPGGKITTIKISGASDASSECCDACHAKAGCVSWCLQNGHTSCNLYKNIGCVSLWISRICFEYNFNVLLSVAGGSEIKTVDPVDTCQGGLLYAPGQPTPPPTPTTPAPTPPHRNTTGLPNIVFLVVESTDGRAWSKGYSNDAIPLPNIRELQNG